MNNKQNVQKFQSIRLWIIDNAPIVIFIALFIIASLRFRSGFLSIFNLTNLLRQISISAIAAIGVNFVMISGGRDLSIGSICAVSSMVIAKFSPYGFIPAVLAGLLVGSVLGFCNGIFVTKLGIPPFIATLGTQLGAKGIALIINNEQSIPLDKDSVAFAIVGRGYLMGIPVPAIIMIVVIAVAHYISRYSKFGRNVYAIGGNEESATMMGVPVHKTKIIIFTISGFTAALAGLVLTSRLSAGLPSAGDGWDMTIMSTVVLGGTLVTGGKGDMRGVLIGALISGIIVNMINMMGNVNSYLQNIINGLMLLFAVIIQAWSIHKREQEDKKS